MVPLLWVINVGVIALGDAYLACFDGIADGKRSDIAFPVLIESVPDPRTRGCTGGAVWQLAVYALRSFNRR